MPGASFLAYGQLLAGFADGDGGQGRGVGFEMVRYHTPMLLDALAQEPGDRFGDAQVRFPFEAVNQTQRQLQNARVRRFCDGRRQQDQGGAPLVDVRIARQ